MEEGGVTLRKFLLSDLHDLANQIVALSADISLSALETCEDVIIDSRRISEVVFAVLCYIHTEDREKIASGGVLKTALAEYVGEYLLNACSLNSEISITDIEPIN